MRYQQIEFKKKINIKLIQDFFKVFPEEKRGRKNFKNKEILNVKSILYNQIIKKGLKIKADCLYTISENLTNDEITIIVSYYKKI
jgi:hypothetical protein